MNNTIKTILIFVGLKISEVIGFILFLFIANRFATFLRMDATAISSNIFIDCFINTLAGIIILVVIFTSIYLFFTLFKDVFSYWIEKNKEWAGDIVYNLNLKNKDKDDEQDDYVYL